MKTIYKYPLNIVDKQVINLPISAEFLHAGLDPVGKPCLWFIVENTNATMDYIIRIIGTGNPLDKDIEWFDHLGSVTMPPDVWHIFLAYI